ncbi:MULTISPECIES: outer membrane-stress sensor serine endopeptidase DegS [Citrobacter]|jgi:serine protease DegS|uniref:peptidase Do n=1 Tax=Citrobacter meridianamericanus TaxID=2894201 RepID=A0ABT1BCN1_9ENTR|nr:MULTISPECIES: outer membrane-stress sensor serine endopeptidase DegS [Citrobacter]MBC6503952.1 outer membrane-stress sensor serine endopeptidase DegS [Citrobacter freundii]MBC6556961.1 outer membrane-stress sensor serine endopeptidase DegS [Citrobacter braakii]MBC6508677.1 outer membrane-stress sensor serine endopeptidase DegS [Citrobacter freundii]MBP8544202.1 outer membrane-stress sensor serine endopeptidase DegS [Citrobacter sp. On2M]MBW5274588.1 outer membrane-stress sensor serine endop
MFVKLLRSVAIGLIVGAILLAAMPSLRKINTLTAPQFDSADETPASYNPAVRRAAPAVVNVYNRSMNSTAHNQLEIRTLGSGVIMDQRGYIITNKHVINDADQIIVALQDGRVFEALLVGSDTLTDLAVLKINATGGLPTIPINNKRVPHIGDVVLAIGNPYNLGQTITQGIISATGRIGLNPTGRQNFLQTDASINHGNSGGALVNSLGELMGINTLSFDKSNDGETPEGIGFAIPFQLATKIMDKLIRDGRVIRGYIGISGREIAPLHAQGGGMDQIQGIVVNEVSPDGPAARAGIQVNDLIISVNNKPAVSALETMDQVAEIRPGSVISVVVMRDDKQLTLQVTIQEYPATN